MPMGTIYNRGTRAKPNWWIKWPRKGRSPGYAKIGPDHAVAKRVLAEKERQELAREHGIAVEERPPIPTFDAAADEWIKMRSAPDASGRPAFRSWRDDQTKLKLHLRPRFGGKHLDQIAVDDVRDLVSSLRAKVAPQTIRNVLNTLSRIYEDQPKAMRLVNPVRALTRQDRQRIGKGWDPRKTPFLKSKGDVRRLYLAFPEMSPEQPFRALYAVGALAGLRPGEARALEWGDVDFATGLIHVQRGEDGPTKDDDSRHVPLVPALAAVLEEWRAHVPVGKALVFPPVGRGRQLDEDAINKALRAALAEAKLPVSLTTYQCGRHTFGAQWVINGGSLEKLRVVLGHSSTEVTLRYGHLVPGEFTPAERSLVDLDLAPARVLPIRRRR